jgi:hypothetical protein
VAGGAAMSPKHALVAVHVSVGSNAGRITRMNVGLLLVHVLTSCLVTLNPGVLSMFFRQLV